MENRKSLYDRLRENNLSFVWLICILNKKGVRVDKSEMSSVARGTIKGNKATTIITTSHEILDKYETFLKHI